MLNLWCTFILWDLELPIYPNAHSGNICWHVSALRRRDIWRRVFVNLILPHRLSRRSAACEYCMTIVECFGRRHIGGGYWVISQRGGARRRIRTCSVNRQPCCAKPTVVALKDILSCGARRTVKACVFYRHAPGWRIKIMHYRAYDFLSRIFWTTPKPQVWCNMAVELQRRVRIRCRAPHVEKEADNNPPLRCKCTRQHRKFSFKLPPVQVKISFSTILSFLKHVVTEESRKPQFRVATTSQLYGNVHSWKFRCCLDTPTDIRLIIH